MSSLLRSISIAMVVAAAAAACSSASSSVPPPPVADASAPVPPPSTQSTNEFQLRTGMRALWEEHAFYTRNYIIAVVNGFPDDEAAVVGQRLFQNQIDIGVAVRPFFGVDGGNQLTALLHEHIQGAADVLAAAVAHDDAAFKTANDAWYQNGYQIALFLASANPKWDLGTMTNHMNRHLDLTLAEASARLAGDWAADVKGYDDVVDHMMTFADFLTQGIFQQFPAIVAPSPMSRTSEELHVTMRRLWEDHVQWTRVYILDQTANLPAQGFSAQRLLRNQSDIGNAIVPFYGQQAGTQLTSLLTTHIVGAVALLQAVESGDQVAIDHSKEAWYTNGDDIAKFLAGANPNWRLADLQFHMKLHLDQTLTEAGAHLGGQWSADVTAYDAVEAHIRSMADVLSDGIAKQFPNRVR